MVSTLLHRLILKPPCIRAEFHLISNTNFRISDLLNQNKFSKISSRKMSTLTGNKHIVAVCQLNSKFDKETNFNKASAIVEDAAKMGAKMIFLPECFDFIAPSKPDILKAAELLEGDIISRYKDMAKNLKVWLSLGGLHERIPNDNEKIKNAHIVIDNEGYIRSVYHKLHLFNLEIPNVVRLLESESYIAGEKIVSPVNTSVGKVGLGICYDVRFSELAIAYAKAGADILTYPSSFTVPTGTYHWEALLRARAIETQCYVIAAAQTGQHNVKRSSYGHAMIVDPWGSVVAQCGEGEGFAIGIIDFDFLKSTRAKLPIWTDRRTDLYAEIAPAISNYPIEDFDYKFSDISITSEQVFYRTRYSFAFINHRPVLKGHCLVSPLRVCAKYSDLSDAEISDMMLTVKRVEQVLEKEYNTNSTTITIQDGVDAGRTVSHVHAHLLPRKPDDFGGNTDKIYTEMARHDKEQFKKDYRKLTFEEMGTISKRLQSYF